MTTRRALLGVAGAAALAAGGARAAEEKQRTGGKSFLQLPTLTAPMVRTGGGRGVLTAQAGIDSPDPTVGARVRLVLPRLLDAYAVVMAGFAAALGPGVLPDVDALVARLQAATDRVVGRPGARFLIGTVLTQ